ncbi:MAG: CBS domain-containing protein [Burkholderiaceae bacterium]|nr:CBS domain-containing protein [Burkholderiaceae bacterium]
MKVSEILKVKGNILYTAPPEMSLLEAINIMSGRDIGSLVVMKDGKMQGMLSFREVMNAIDRQTGSVAGGTVGEHMATNIMTISPDTEINDIRRLMLERHARYVPVLDHDGTLMGVMSFYDVAKAVFEAQTFENKMLKAYIRDWPAETEE